MGDKHGLEDISPALDFEISDHLMPHSVCVPNRKGLDRKTYKPAIVRI